MYIVVQIKKPGVKNYAVANSKTSTEMLVFYYNNVREKYSWKQKSLKNVYLKTWDIISRGEWLKLITKMLKNGYAWVEKMSI